MNEKLLLCNNGIAADAQMVLMLRIFKLLQMNDELLLRNNGIATDAQMFF
jgi:hypothetical protein